MNLSLQSRLIGSARTLFLQELFENSLHFPIFNILLEMLVEGWRAYLFSPDGYIIALAGLVQAYFLSHWQGFLRLPGNLIGPAIYTLVEVLMDGPRFFASPNHLLYWGVSLFFGLVQAPRPLLVQWLLRLTMVVEDIVRASILTGMYFIFELKTNPEKTVTLQNFFSDPSHLFVTLVAIFLGLNIGLGRLTAQRYLELLRETFERLKTYSEWFFGRDLLGQVIQDPAALQLKRQERSVLFMDIRGFTHWSETRSPEEVVSMLNRYYQIAEATITRQAVVKIKLNADEVMAIFPSVDDGLQSALRLQAQVNQFLEPNMLSAGIGFHVGPVVEGLLGSQDVKFYDVIGDTVNTAKRIESAAGPGEVLVSEAIRLSMGDTFRAGSKRFVSVKGKDEPVAVYPLE